MALLLVPISSMHHAFLQWYVSHKPCSCIHHWKQIHWLVYHQASCIPWTSDEWHQSNQACVFRHLECLLYTLVTHTCHSCIQSLVSYHATYQQEDHVNQSPTLSSQFLLHPIMPWYPMLWLVWLDLVYQHLIQFHTRQWDHCLLVLVYLDVSPWDLPKSKYPYMNDDVLNWLDEWYNLLEEDNHNSRYSLCKENSCVQSEVCPFSHLVSKDWMLLQ